MVFNIFCFACIFTSLLFAFVGYFCSEREEKALTQLYFVQEENTRLTDEIVFTRSCAAQAERRNHRLLEDILRHEEYIARFEGVFEQGLDKEIENEARE